MSYTTENIFLTIRQVKLIGKKKFTIATLNLEHKLFIVYIATFNVNLGDKVHLLKKAQIAYLKANEAFTKVFSKYIDFADVFLPKLAAKFLEHRRII